MYRGNARFRAARKDPLVEAPSDLVFVGRAMGLLSGIGKQLGSEVNLMTTLRPYLMSYMGSENEKPDNTTIPEDSVETATPELSRG